MQAYLVIAICFGSMAGLQAAVRPLDMDKRQAIADDITKFTKDAHQEKYAIRGGLRTSIDVIGNAHQDEIKRIQAAFDVQYYKLEDILEKLSHMGQFVISRGVKEADDKMSLEFDAKKAIEELREIAQKVNDYLPKVRSGKKSA